MKQILISSILCSFIISSCQQKEHVLFYDDFSQIRRGPYSAEVGAHTEYHYLHEAAPRSAWAVSTFTWEPGFMRAWEVRQSADGYIFYQGFTNRPDSHSHPMLVVGDDLWKDYSVAVKFSPESKDRQSGICFRYQNDRCYYFFGVKGDSAILKIVDHATAFHKPLEKVLAGKSFQWEPGSDLTAKIEAYGDQLTCRINSTLLKATDRTWTGGKIALTADIPTSFSYVKVTTKHNSLETYKSEKEEQVNELKELRAANPKMRLWKKIKTQGFGVGRNLRFGDLDNDGQIDVLIGQVLHHGPQDRNSELSCLTAMTFNGEILWQTGTPDSWKNHLTNDVAFQIHDINNDGKNEVIFCMNLQIIVADAETGKTLYQKPTPHVTDQEIIDSTTHNRFGQILGDCLFFCDLDGNGYKGNIIIKDRYRRIWAMDKFLNVLWYRNLNTGHYPYAYDIDDDQKDEVMIGYTLLDDDGTTIWTLEEQIDDHADGVAIVRYKEEEDPMLLCAASDEGVFFADLQGNIIKHHYIGHGQNPAIANFRDDLPGLETVSINFWGNQGIVTYYNSDGDPYLSIEPNQYGSMCLPINWTGRSEEFFVHNPNVDEGGLFDGWGRKVVEFPDDGHPDMCNAVLDITGDCRDEIVVWNPNEIWVYTQDDSPLDGILYKPKRNDLSNYSNYQATVSLPGWKR